MANVDATAPYFIRCIKPNHAKAPNQLQMKMVIEQLTYAGVFEAVKIRKGGYPFRLPHAVFAHKNPHVFWMSQSSTIDGTISWDPQRELHPGNWGHIQQED